MTKAVLVGVVAVGCALYLEGNVIAVPFDVEREVQMLKFATNNRTVAHATLDDKVESAVERSSSDVIAKRNVLTENLTVTPGHQILGLAGGTSGDGGVGIVVLEVPAYGDPVRDIPGRGLPTVDYADLEVRTDSERHIIVVQDGFNATKPEVRPDLSFSDFSSGNVGLPRGVIRVSGLSQRVSAVIERSDQEHQADDPEESLDPPESYHPEGRTRAILLGLQVFVGALCFPLGCIGVSNADDQLHRRVRGAVRYGVLSLLLVFGGLSLYASGAILLAYI